MSDMSSMNRESKKRQLKRQVIDPHALPPSYNRPKPKHNGAPGESEEEIVRKAEKRVKKKRLRIFLITIILLSAAGLLAYRHLHVYQYTDYDIGWEVDMPPNDGSFAKYERFGDNLLKYTKDGASYIDSSGKTLWSLPYELKSPICYVNGGYAAIADQQGNSIYICDKTGSQGVATTLLPILKVSVSSYGEVAALVEDSGATYITFFKKDGSILDWNIKTKLSGDGFLTDVSLSPEGTQVMVADAYLDKGTIKNKVVFYNFSDFGKKYPKRLVGGFDEEYENSMIGRVRFLSEKYACVFADDSIAFFSLENVTSPAMLTHIPIEEQIKSVMYSDTYAGVIVSNESGENDSRMDIYKEDGSLMFSEEFRYQYRSADIDGDKVILYNENSCRVYNMAGKLKFTGEFDFTVSKVTTGKFPNTLIVTGPETMKEIKFK